MYRYETLENTDVQTLHEAFLEAFSDYQVPIQMPFTVFATMLNRKGYAPEISLGAFTESDHKLVGFVMNGLRRWDGQSTAYDLGTGVAPRHRKQGLTSTMLQMVTERLAQKEVTQYLLEVLQDNQTAFSLYQQQGFVITREFSCFGQSRQLASLGRMSCAVAPVASVSAEDWARWQQFWDFAPSWQNSLDSVRAVLEAFVCVVARQNDLVVGYGVVEKATGDIPQLAVQKEYRRQGLATSIIAALAEHTEAAGLKVINVDDTCDNMKSWLTRVGFKMTARQYEMIVHQG